ncbi:MAG: hypothetical protein RBT70_10045 [Alphaproteobacteria bacterium]|jgi:uncharacterized membrane protein YvbJ|nr:hypothetical protein [Alphaproteobacteria bacterium]
MNALYCSRCGTEASERALYCRSCGERLETPTVVIDKKTVSVGQPAKRQNPVDQGVKDTFTSKTFRFFMTAVILLVCVLPVACLFFGLVGLFPLSAFIDSLLQ